MFSKDQIESVIYGAAVADALGGPYEFFTKEELKNKKIEMSGGANKLAVLRPGEWTDDTEMTLMLAETLAEGMPINFESLAKRYISWADSMPKDIGTTTKHALVGSSSFREATAKAARLYYLSQRSGGNGTIMRASPLAFLPLNEPGFRDAIKTEAAITHGSPEAAQAAYLQAFFIRQLLQDKKIFTQKLLSLDFSDLIINALTNYRDEDYIAQEVERGGTSWSSLAVALHSLKFDNYSDGVKWAISLGYDTDTNASCAGALLGSRDGINTIPADWIHKLENKERINRAINGLVAIQSG
jgi:ADP-ribosyl-[dinitrogen reductase] hydrolase